VLVFWKERLVLLAVPKTGTTALEGALAPRAALVLRDPPQVKHAPLYRYRRFVEPLLATAGRAEFETVAVLREPVSWLGSWFRYRTRDDVAGRPTSTRGMSFDAFVEEYCKDRPAAFAQVGQQARFVLNEDGTQGATHLFRYEEPERLHAFLSERLGLRLDLPRLNVSPEMAVSLSPEVEARLRAARPQEFAVWAMAGGAG
jgi:hypothetical protein